MKLGQEIVNNRINKANIAYHQLHNTEVTKRSNQESQNTGVYLAALTYGARRSWNPLVKYKTIITMAEINYVPRTCAKK